MAPKAKRDLDAQTGPDVSSIKSLAELDSNEEVFRKHSSLDWNFSEADTSYLTHDIHPYPAKFIPQIPHQLTLSLSLPGELIWDPFGGSGTTALEAALLRRRCISNDLNPLGALIGQVKTTLLDYDKERELAKFMKIAKVPRNQMMLVDSQTNSHEPRIRTPPIPHLEDWFHKNAIAGLAHLKSLIEKRLTTPETKNIAMVALSRTIGKVSNQDSETRYVRRPRNIRPYQTMNTFVSDMKFILSRLRELRQKLKTPNVVFTSIDMRTDALSNAKNAEVRENSIDLIVTSPPYPNATDYHLYHRFRLFWLGYDPRQIARAEIGSHLRHQKEKTGFENYLTDMRPCLKNMFLALRPGRYAALVLGDAIYKGQLFATAEEISAIAVKLGFQYVGIIERKIHNTRRSFIRAARRARKEKILLLRKPPIETWATLEESSYKLWPYEKELSKKEIEMVLHTCVERKDDKNWLIYLGSTKIDKVKRLTFTKGISSNHVGSELTWQSILENGSSTNANQLKKESKYVTHGIHSYKGKFYPQLAKVLFNVADLDYGSRILDPFCGSGTVLLEAYLNGFRSFGCDLNPLAVEITRAKTEILDVDPHVFEWTVSNFLKRLKRAPGSREWLSNFSDDAIEEMSRWFPDPVACKLGWLLFEIDEISDMRIRRFLRVLLSSIVRQVSHQEPSDLRTRRRKEPLHDAPILDLFRNAVQENSSKVIQFGKIINHSPNPMFYPARVWLGDARDYTSFTGNGVEGESVDAVVTSPPYATALPYIDTDRLSILILFGLTSRQRSEIERNLVGSREISLRERKELETRIQPDDFGVVVSTTAKEVIEQVYSLNAEANVGFRRKNMASLLFRYFNDMTKVLSNLDRIVKKGGSIFIVIGDNKTVAGGRTVDIGTTRILQETGEKLGWSVQELMPITVTQENYKHIRNSISNNTIVWFRRN